MAQKLLHLDITHKKSETPSQKIFFQVQTRRLADTFECLNSSLAQSTEKNVFCSFSEECKKYVLLSY